MTDAAPITTGLAEDLRRSIGEAGCPVCRRLRAAEERYWDGMLYEGFQDGGALAEFTDAIGLCPRHLVQLAERDDAFAAAQLALAGLRGALQALEPTSSSRRRRRAKHMPAPGRACPACRVLATHELHALETLGALLKSEPDAAQRYWHSDGVCFDHLRRATEASVPAVELLRCRQHEILASHREAVERLIAAHDYHAEESTADPESWKRAFAALRGVPGAHDEMDVR